MMKTQWYWWISSQTLVQEAEHMWLVVEIINKKKNLFVVRNEHKEVLFKSTDFGENTALWNKLVNDKELAYMLLDCGWFPIAKSMYLTKDAFGVFDMSEMRDFQFPLVVKPINGSHGDGVMMHIMSYDELRRKLISSFETYVTMVVQEQIEWQEYRVLVVKWEVIVAINRLPAYVIWDGRHTIQQLIEKENTENMYRGSWYKQPLSHICIDAEVLEYLRKHDRQLSDIPDVSEMIQLRWNSNVGTWGMQVNVTDIVCDDIKNMCIDVSNLFWLSICGVDVISTDITKPLKHTKWIILELNANPGIWGDLEVVWVNSGKRILEKLFH